MNFLALLIMLMILKALNPGTTPERDRYLKDKYGWVNNALLRAWNTNLQDEDIKKIGKLYSWDFLANPHDYDHCIDSFGFKSFSTMPDGSRKLTIKKGDMWYNDDPKKLFQKKLNVEFRRCLTCGTLIPVIHFKGVDNPIGAERWYCPTCDDVVNVRMVSKKTGEKYYRQMVEGTYEYPTINNPIVERTCPWENEDLKDVNRDFNLPNEVIMDMAKNPYLVFMGWSKRVDVKLAKTLIRLYEVDRFSGKYAYGTFDIRDIDGNMWYVKHKNGEMTFYKIDISEHWEIRYVRCKECGERIPILVWLDDPSVRVGLPRWYCPNCGRMVRTEAIEETEEEKFEDKVERRCNDYVL